MERFLSGWTPTPEAPYSRLDIPAGAGPVDLKLRITPGALEEGKQTVLLTAVTMAWNRGAARVGSSKSWLLWQIKVFAAHGKAVIEMDGRGPQKREVEPLKATKRWDIGGPRGLSSDASGPYHDVAITYNAQSGALSILRHSESLTGTTWLKTDEPWAILVGKPPSFISDLALPLGWRFDVDFQLAGRPGPVTSPPVEPPPSGRTDIEQIETSMEMIEDEVMAVRRVLRRLKGGA